MKQKFNQILQSCQRISSQLRNHELIQLSAQLYSMQIVESIKGNVA